MITLKDIRTSIIKLLRRETDITHVHGEEVQQKQFPLLVVLLMPDEMQTAAAGLHTHKSILVDIIYMENTRTSNEKNYEMLEVIDGIIRPVLYVRDRAFTIQQASMEITDNVAHYKFYLNFTDVTGKLPADKEIPLMETINMDLKKEDKNGIT